MTIKGKYTEAVHARRVIRMMELRRSCPASHSYLFCAETFRSKACAMCREFVSIRDEMSGYGFCPCCALGNYSEAYKRTWLALEEKGYLDENP